MLDASSSWDSSSAFAARAPRGILVAAKRDGLIPASDGPALHIWGSSELLQTLIAADLVDEHRLWVGAALLLVANEVSSTPTIWEIR
jgi:hypothetical protein